MPRNPINFAKQPSGANGLAHVLGETPWSTAVPVQGIRLPSMARDHFAWIDQVVAVTLLEAGKRRNGIGGQE